VVERVSHSFASRAPKPARTLIQQGVVALLSPLTRRSGGYLHGVVPFGAVVRSYTDEIGTAMLQDALKATPAIAIATGTFSGQNLAIGGRQNLGQIELLLYIATGHARSQQRGRQESDLVAQADDQADPGLHVIMEHARELVLGQYPSIDTFTVKQIMFEREEEVATLPQITIWLQTYRVTVQSYSGSREFRTAQQLLESIGWRATTDADEDLPPDPATSSTSVDADTNL
jgi:hypothetical protein